MRSPLTIAVAQPLTVALDVAANAVAHADAVRSAAARLVVFPEMSLTGYEFDALPVDPADPRLAPLVRACSETGSIALAGAPVEDEAGRHISILAIDGSGVRIAYLKMWLGGDEREHFAPGSAPAALDVDGWRLGLAICKDTGVERHAAETTALGIDAYVAGVLESVEDSEVPAERACRIATKYGVAVAIASFAGSTGAGYEHAAGRSGIWDRDGRLLGRAGAGPGDLARATIR